MYGINWHVYGDISLITESFFFLKFYKDYKRSCQFLEQITNLKRYITENIQVSWKCCASARNFIKHLSEDLQCSTMYLVRTPVYLEVNIWKYYMFQQKICDNSRSYFSRNKLNSVVYFAENVFQTVLVSLKI